MNKLLEETITKSQEEINKSKDWHLIYESQAKVLTENKELLDQFYKQVKTLEEIQFYLAEVSTTPPAVFKILAKYQGQAIALITLTKDCTLITTEDYEETNKKTYGCTIQLEQVDLKTKEAMQFLNFFNKEITPKTKIDEQAHTQAMLLSEFSKTSSVGKLLLGCQPVRYSNLFYPIPITLKPKEETGYIDILTRTKVRKLTIIETMKEDQTPEMILTNGTSKAIFLLNLLHSEQGQQWYKIFGFHGRVTPHLTIKVCIAVPKELKAKCKEFEPYELRAGTDSIEYHYMTYETDGTKATKIDTTLNN